MYKEQDIELIERYLRDELNPNERANLDNRLKTDRTFETLFESESLAFIAIGDKEGQEFLSTLDAVARDYHPQHRRYKLNPSKILYAMAAAVTVFFAAFFLFRESAGPQDLFNQYYEPYPMLTVQRSADNSETKVLADAYAREDWSLVLDKLNEINAEYLALPLNHLYRAIAYMERDEAYKATLLLNDYADNPVDPLYQDPILWYLSLAYLKENQKEEALKVLNSLRMNLTEGTDLKENVQALIRKLE